jgi:hypothetical protein
MHPKMHEAFAACTIMGKQMRFRVSFFATNEKGSKDMCTLHFKAMTSKTPKRAQHLEDREDMNSVYATARQRSPCLSR